MRCYSQLLAVAVVLLSAPTAHAESHDEAQKHFKEGVALSKQGHHSEALTEFQKAYAAVPSSASALFNIGYEHEILGDRDDAIDFYRRYLAAAKHATDRKKVEEAIKKLGGQPRGEHLPEPAHRPAHYVAPRRELDRESFNEDTTVSAQEVSFRPGAAIHVAGGKTLRIIADRLVVPGPVQIVATGTPGRPGASGSGPPQWTTESFAAWKASCNGPSDGGGPGGQGESGQDGGNVEVYFRTLRGNQGDLQVDVSGGKGGRGGEGGPGRLCRGPDATAHQKYGPRGPQGPSGEQGKPGTFTFRRLDGR